jgi:hypothetical protein
MVVMWKSLIGRNDLVIDISNNMRRILGPERDDETEPLGNLHNNYFLDDQIKEDEIDGASSMHGGDDKCIHNLD